MTRIKFLIGSQGENIFLALQQDHRIIVVYHPTDHWILAVQKCYFFNPTLPVILENTQVSPICEPLPTAESALRQLLQSFQKAVIARERKKKKKGEKKKRKIITSHISTKILGRKTNKGHKKVYYFLSQLILECYAMSSAMQKFKTYAHFIQKYKTDVKSKTKIIQIKLIKYWKYFHRMDIYIIWIFFFIFWYQANHVSSRSSLSNLNREQLW